MLSGCQRVGCAGDSELVVLIVVLGNALPVGFSSLIGANDRISAHI